MPREPPVAGCGLRALNIGRAKALKTGELAALVLPTGFGELPGAETCCGRIANAEHMRADIGDLEEYSFLRSYRECYSVFMFAIGFLLDVFCYTFWCERWQAMRSGDLIGHPHETQATTAAGGQKAWHGGINRREL